MKIKYRIIFSLIFVLSLSFRCIAYAEKTVSKYEQARDLYAKGPSQAQEIIRLLKEELNENPENEKAIMLLGITYFGIEQFEDALQQFDNAINLADKQGVIRHRIIFYKARALHELSRDNEARKILDAFWAFFQDKGELQQQYEVLYNEVLEKLEDK